MHFAGTSQDAPIYERRYLVAGNRIHGPALVVEKSATTVVEPDYQVEVTPHGHLSITREA
jgi:5-oxoprolinase (ATP-hydrolysing)